MCSNNLFTRGNGWLALSIPCTDGQYACSEGEGVVNRGGGGQREIGKGKGEVNEGKERGEREGWIWREGEEGKKEKRVERSPGGTHTFSRMGMCRPNGSLFYKKSLNMGPIFYPKKSLNMGQLLWLSPKLCDCWGFHQAKTQKIVEFLKNRPIFEGKSLKMGTLFGQNHP